MSTRMPFTSPSARMLVGVALVLVALGLSGGVWYTSERDLRTLDWYEANRSPSDSAGYASAQYHAAYARATRDGRWHPTGYAALGSLGTLLGLGIAIGGWRARRR